MQYNQETRCRWVCLNQEINSWVLQLYLKHNLLLQFEFIWMILIRTRRVHNSIKAGGYQGRSLEPGPWTVLLFLNGYSNDYVDSIKNLLVDKHKGINLLFYQPFPRAFLLIAQGNLAYCLRARAVTRWSWVH